MKKLYLLFAIFCLILSHTTAFTQIKADSIIRNAMALQSIVDDCNDNFSKVLLTLNNDSATAWINSIDNSFICVPLKESSFSIQEKNDEYLLLFYGTNNIKKFKFQENKAEPLNRIAFTCKSKNAALNNVKLFENLKNIFLQKAKTSDSIVLTKYILAPAQIDSITLLLNKNFSKTFFKIDENLKATINTPNGYFVFELFNINFNINDVDEKKNKIRFFGNSAIEKFDKNMQLTGISNRETLLCHSEKNAKEALEILRYFKKSAIVKKIKSQP